MQTFPIQRSWLCSAVKKKLAVIRLDRKYTTQPSGSDRHKVAVEFFSWSSEVEVLDPAVDEVKWLNLWATVQLCFDLLWVCVRGQLLCALLGQQEQGMAVRVMHLKLFSTQLTYLLCGGVWPHLQSFSCTPTVCFLKCHS